MSEEQKNAWKEELKIFQLPELPQGITKADYNVAVGSNNLSNAKLNAGGYTHNIVVGHFNDVGRNGGMDRITLPSESMAKIISELDDYQKASYGFSVTDNTIDAFSNNITIGNRNNVYTNETPTRSVGSINIGSGNQKGIYRDFFNIYIGNHIKTARKANPQSYDNIIIGNFITTWQDQGILAIHNSTDGFTAVQDALIYGGFRNRFFKVNGKLTINPTYASQVDETFNKVAVVNNSGDVGFKDITSLAGNTSLKEEIIENGSLAFFRDRLKTTVLKQGDLLYFEFKFTDMNNLSDVDTSQKAYIGQLPSGIDIMEDKVLYTSFGELHLGADRQMHIVMYNTSMGNEYSVTAFTIL